MSYHPVPPPMPLPTHPFHADHQVHEPSRTGSGSSGFGQSSPNTELMGGRHIYNHQQVNQDGNQHTKSNKVTGSSGQSNVLSSQEFKDELVMKQARLSPNPDSALSIDDKIRIRKENKQAAKVESATHSDDPHVSRLPDKLVNSSSTLQRDKRPFAYSPDVNDPKNRGKLDLSQIKSPIMRRRLMANMESSHGDIDDKNEESDNDCVNDKEQDIRHENLDSNQPACGASSKSHNLPIFSSSDEYQNMNQQQQEQLPSKAQINRNSLTQLQQQRSKTISTSTTSDMSHHEPIVYYKQPPVFYSNCRADQILYEPPTIDRSIGFDRQLHAPAKTLTENYLDSLNADIAESLQSLSFLANNLDHKTQSIPATSRSDNHRHEMPPYKDSQLRHHGTNSSCNKRPQQQQQQPQRQQPLLSNVSTFLPHAGGVANLPSYDDSMVRREDGAHQRPQPYRARNQHCPGEANARIVGDDYLLSPTTDYFGTGPYQMSPFYGAPLADVDETVAGSWSSTRVNKPTTSHGTFCTYQNSTNNTNSEMTTGDGHRNSSPRPRPSPSPQQQQPQPQPQPQPKHSYHSTPSSSSQDYYQSNFLRQPKLGAGSDRHNTAQVRALQEMTAKLEREVNRLHNWR